MLYSKYFTDIMNEESLKIFSEDPRTINDILKLANHHFSDLVAFRNNKGLLRTFSELNEDVAKTRSYLKQNGINPGDHIGIVLNNDYDFVKLFLAIATMGCVAVLIPVQMPKNNIVDVGQFTNCKMIIDSSSLPILLDDSTTPEINTKPNDDAVIIFTGGTINKPKAVLLTHGNLSRGAMNGCYGFKNSLRRVYYDFIPFTHVFGLVRNLLTGIASGSEQFLCIDMNDFITDLRICKPTILALVPALAELVWSLLKKDKEIVGGRLKTIICGGAPVPPSLIKKLFAEGINIHPGYGLTETANLVSGNANPLDKPTSVGRPFNFQEIKIVDGELWIKGENVVKEYYHNPINTKLAFEGEWLKTGDLAKIDKDGDLYIVGRIKNLIIFDNGEKVSPEALENELNNYPLIKDSLVYGDKNESGNQVITAEILPNIEYAKNVKISDITLAIHNIIDEINNHVPIYMGIHKIIIRTQDFERSSSKKIIRKY